MVVDKYTQLNAIKDVWEPKYSTGEVYIAKWKITRSKLDIKLEFPKVSDTSEYAGVWYISRKKAKSFKSKFDNNGVECLAIPMSAFERLEISNVSKEIW